MTTLPRLYAPTPVLVSARVLEIRWYKAVDADEI